VRHATIVCNGLAIEFNVGNLVVQGDIVPQQFDARSRVFRRQRLTLNENVRSIPAATRGQPRSRVDAPQQIDLTRRMIAAGRVSGASAKQRP